MNILKNEITNKPVIKMVKLVPEYLLLAMTLLEYSLCINYGSKNVSVKAQTTK
jgi:hypothetical protein